MARKRRNIGRNIIPNQVFIGCPFWTIRAKYEAAFAELKKKYPISFVIVGRGDGQEAQDLLILIKAKLFSSSAAIFDATGGNANVSLEFGLAERDEIPRVLYLSTHKAARRGPKDLPIIADLAGKRRNQYAKVSKLLELLRGFCGGHNYTVRFEKFLRERFRSATKGQKKRARALALKVIHFLDGRQESRRTDLVQSLLADASSYREPEIEAMVGYLHKEGLIRIEPGRYSSVSIQ